MFQQWLASCLERPREWPFRGEEWSEDCGEGIEPSSSAGKASQRKPCDTVALAAVCLHLGHVDKLQQAAASCSKLQQAAAARGPVEGPVPVVPMKNLRILY